MSDASKGVIGFRLSPEMRAGVEAYCQQHELSITDLYRALTESLLTGQISLGSIEGYKSARSMAIQLAGIVVAQAASSLPETLEEAQARYGLVG